MSTKGILLLGALFLAAASGCDDKHPESSKVEKVPAGKVDQADPSPVERPRSRESVPDAAPTADRPAFVPPDRSTPERTLRTFWWAIKNGENDIALSCVDRNKVAAGWHGRDIDEYIREAAALDTTDFKFKVSKNRVSIQSPHYMMDYDLSVGPDGKWLIEAIHP